ncbi:uncharacterized protein LOC123469427 isoform X1 [Daphnia magna]|uniref:Uncharacterized protein n=1 Tax=Daphnia magna TaxID=35525 RepID=A0ABQ9YSS7_9CRUS|nr:uncharacterized protein LOC123469427 isoform X1 [Daphnia magna]KAK4003677.1 hypothetical protein OUZ56_005433 [Daphnia magna]
MLSQPAQTSMRCHPAHILFPIPSVPAVEDRNSLKTKAGVQYWFTGLEAFTFLKVVDNMEAESSEMGQVDTEEVDLGSQEAVIDLIDQKNPNYKGNAKQVPIDLPSSCQEILQSGFQNIVVEELEPPIVDLNELVQAASNLHVHHHQILVNVRFIKRTKFKVVIISISISSI